MKTGLIKILLILSIMNLQQAGITNAVFKSNGIIEKSGVSTNYWVDPEIRIEEDKNEYSYDHEENIEITWEVKVYEEPSTLTFNIYVLADGSDKFKDLERDLKDISEYELKYNVLKEKFDLNDNSNFNFIIKVEVIDEHNLKDSALSNSYTYQEENDRKEEEKDENEDSTDEGKDNDDKIVPETVEETIAEDPTNLETTLEETDNTENIDQTDSTEETISNPTEEEIPNNEEDDSNEETETPTQEITQEF